METDNKGGGKERRKAKRVYASFVEYCHVEAEATQKFQAFTENISATGICILVNEEIRAGSLLLVTIYLLDGTASIETKGRVAWSKPSAFLASVDKKHLDVGIEFVEIAEEDKKRLIAYANKYPNEALP